MAFRVATLYQDRELECTDPLEGKLPACWPQPARSHRGDRATRVRSRYLPAQAASTRARRVPLRSPRSIRAPIAPTPATTAAAKVAAKAYISTLIGTGSFLNHSILSVRPLALFSRHRIPPSLILL